MADFYQTGVVTTLHRLGATRLDLLEAELVEYAEDRPIMLVIPALASEMDGAALPHIVEVPGGPPPLGRRAAAHLRGRSTHVPPLRRRDADHRRPSVAT